MIGAKMIADKKWFEKGVKNMEEFDAKYFLEELNQQGLPWEMIELNPEEV
jgi:saccharopine dehydrogenase (NAD+, L-lysine-forming)